MDQSKRKFLKVLPLAALVSVAVKVGEEDALAYEIRSDRKYIFVIPHWNGREHEAKAAREVLLQRGIDATIVAGVDDLHIYELQ
jgi:hypothetical protein